MFKYSPFGFIPCDLHDTELVRSSVSCMYMYIYVFTVTCDFIRRMSDNTGENTPAGCDIICITSCKFPGYGVDVDQGHEARLTPYPSRFQLISPGLDQSPNSVSFKYLQQPTEGIVNNSHTDCFLCVDAGKLAVEKSPENGFENFSFVRDQSESDRFRVSPSSGGSLRADDKLGPVRIISQADEGSLFLFERAVDNNDDKGSFITSKIINIIINVIEAACNGHVEKYFRCHKCYQQLENQHPNEDSCI